MKRIIIFATILFSTPITFAQSTNDPHGGFGFTFSTSLQEITNRLSSSNISFQFESIPIYQERYIIFETIRFNETGNMYLKFFSNQLMFIGYLNNNMNYTKIKNKVNALLNICTENYGNPVISGFYDSNNGSRIDMNDFPYNRYSEEEIIKLGLCRETYGWSVGDTIIIVNVISSQSFFDSGIKFDVAFFSSSNTRRNDNYKQYIDTQSAQQDMR